MTVPPSSRCGVVLAGGDGTHLKALVTQLTGENLPKQYVNLIGTRSMLEHTFDRAERLIPVERLFTVANQNHLGYREARRQLAKRPTGTVVIQPKNKETGPGILFALMHVAKKYPGSNVALFPSDHFVLQENLFMAYVALAFYVVESNPSSIVLLGIVPDGPEGEYGYILPDGDARDLLSPLRVHEVKLFVEKPGPAAAQEMVLDGGLWNTMVMVFNTTIILDLVRRVAPELYDPLQKIETAIGTSKEKSVVDEIYRQIKPRNFSVTLLEALSLLRPSCISVLPVSGVFWSDWGSEHRIVSTLRKTGYLERFQAAVETRLCAIGSSI
jgi:mannose-1-phosphate guanylyltransferase